MSETQKTITIKKSEIAVLRTYGKTNKQIADRYGITTGEVHDALVSFGMAKARSTKKTKDYVVVLEDDMQHMNDTTDTTGTVEVTDDVNVTEEEGNMEMETTEESAY